MKYRPEIDGLRALAVVPVIFYHAGIKSFSGGYVGVDVFFVISGYLITSIIMKSLERNQFSIVDFYERRARRILPALFLVILACVPFSWVLMLPSDFINFYESILATMFFSSNIYFSRTIDYFTANAEQIPLLHTWSLAVEEQYYVFFPPFLMALWKIRRNIIVPTLVFTFLASLGLCIWLTPIYPEYSFYLLPTRGWEILLGALCALYLRQADNREPTSNVLSMIGLVGVLLSIVLYDHQTINSGFSLLLPNLGTALLILTARKGTLVYRFLTLKPFVQIGLISYSAYLWHQPLLAFARLDAFGEPSIALKLALCVISIVVAYFSWKYIEAPFREKTNGTYVLNRKTIFVSSGVGIALMSLMGAAGAWSSGFPDRINPEVRYFSEISKDLSPLKEECAYSTSRQLDTSNLNADCFRLLEDDTPSVLITGDSHALTIGYQLQNVLEERGVSSLSTSYASCIGLKGFYRIFKGQNHKCNEFNETIVDYAKSNGVSTIVISSYWLSYVYGFNEKTDFLKQSNRYIEKSMIEQLGVETPFEALRSVERTDRILKAIQSEILALSAHFNVVIVNQVPENTFNPPIRAIQMYPSITDHSIKQRETMSLSRSYQAHMARTAAFTEMLNQLPKDNIRIVSPSEVLCPDKQDCPLIMDNELLYYDHNHLASSTGSKLIAPLIADAIMELEAPNAIK